MRLKKIMSLVLACAMALSLITVASAADTKVYYAEDFSGYADLDTYLASQSRVAGTNDSNHNIGATTLGNLKTGRDTLNKSVHAFATSSNIAFGTDNFSFTTNGFGSKALQVNNQEQINKIISNSSLVSAGWIGMGQGTFGIMPKETWKLTAEENKDETYVVSFELQAETTKHPGSWGRTSYQRPIGVVWSNDEGAQTATNGALQYDFSADPVVVTTPEEGQEPDSVVRNEIYTAPQTWALHAVYTNWDSGQKSATLNSGDTHRIAFGYKYADQEEPMKIFAMDGAHWPGWSGSLSSKQDDHRNDHSVYHTIDGIWFTYGTKAIMNFANIKIYTIKDNSFKATIENNTNVPLNTKTVRVKFGNPVAPETWSNAVVVKADGVPMAEGSYAVGSLGYNDLVEGGEAYSYVDVTFGSLEEGTTYTIDFADTIANEIATPLGEENSVATFSTKLPDVKLMPLTIVGADSLVADGSLQAVKAQLINNTSAPKNVALIYAVYGANGQLADVVYVNDVVENTTDYEVGLKLAAAGSLKAFAWDGMTSLKPYTGSQTVAIAAAQ